MTYNLEIINICIQIYQHNKNIKNISKITSIGMTTLYRYYNKYTSNFVNCVPLNEYNIVKKEHRLNKINKYTNTVINYLENNTVLHKKDILLNNPDIKLSLSSINKILKINKYSYKIAKNKFNIKDETLLESNRYNYSKTITDDNFLNSISLDECSFDINDYQKKYYAKKGTIAITNFKHKRRKRVTLLLAVSNIDIIAYKIFYGSLNKHIYPYALQELLIRSFAPN